MTLAWPSEKPWYRKLLYLCLLPIMVPLVLTIPDPKRGKPGTKSASSRFAFWGYNLFALSFIMSIVWIALWSYLMVWWVERTGWLCCIPSVVSISHTPLIAVADIGGGGGGNAFPSVIRPPADPKGLPFELF